MFEVYELKRLRLPRAIWAFNLTCPVGPCVCHLSVREHVCMWVLLLY